MQLPSLVNQIRKLKLFTQDVFRRKFKIGGAATGPQFIFMTGLKWVAAFPYPDLDWVCHVKIKNRFMTCIYPKKREK